jgi:hypothetical protein
MNRFYVLTMLIGLAFWFWTPSPVLANGGDCRGCHQKHNVDYDLPKVSPILIKADGQTVSIDLPTAFAYHGHECPGVTTAYLAMQYAIQLLYGNEIPERNDLMIASRMPRGGPMDMFDLMMKGDNPALSTWPLDVKPSPDLFSFTVYRKSTAEAVDIQVKPGVFPAEFFVLKQKQKNKTITMAEWDRLHQYLIELITVNPTNHKAALFGEPKPYKTLWWGTLATGEMDRHIRQIRQQAKKRKAPR